MTRFKDIYLPGKVPGWPCQTSPRFSTRIVAVDSGAEQANRRWQHPLRRFHLPEAVREHEVFEAIHAHWLVMGGPAHSWPFRDPLDFSSCPLQAPNRMPMPRWSDQVIGVGDGSNRDFYLQKTYSRGAETYVRPILFPVVASVSIGVNGAAIAPGAFDPATRPGGRVNLDVAPGLGEVVTAGFLFDCEVRFEADDSFDGIVQTYQVSGFADLTLVEVRPE